ncbi:hypothetical protein GG681_09355 [Epibacterium sp. SM1969]|uniref:RiboL-PSP-HEPN domain-containing protein n=1 Tax=Tritonibacter aquimaris TaxID=2663379 RepID=A0A844ATZ1_9RHOB|nr:MAE_28990/MAE_18760 family HEPN-like nuclease [Tritonibacter aquimaris]MQY42848.1 hypothetical protein [Tritonibacter aquimaris]
MSRYTVAYSAFLERLDEVDRLLKMAVRFERDNALANAPEIDALCRGAVVLLSSHMEGFVKEIGELVLTRIYSQKVCRSDVSNLVSYHASRDIISEIRDTSNAESISDKIIGLFERDLNLWEQNGPFPDPIPEDRFNKSFSSPSFNKVSSYMNRFGYSLFKRDLKATLKGDYLPCRNMVDHVVDVRNKIAHGDPSVSKTPSDLFEAVQTIKTFCRATDDVVAGWCKLNICSIR